MERVTYMEQEVVLLEDFNVRVCRGEIMGMLYANSHGMTAFLKLLQTNLPLYDGYVYYAGEPVNSWKESKKTPNRISIISTESCLVETMSVYDNVFVLRQGFRQEIIRNKLLRKQLAPFLRDIKMDIPVDICVEKLSVFERLVVELLRAVVVGNRLIVLNEIGNLVSYQELEKLHGILRHYAKQGFSFIYICPHFEEMIDICDRVSFFTNGRIQKVFYKEEMQDSALKFYLTEYGQIVKSRLEKRSETVLEEIEVMEFRNITGNFIKNVSFRVFQGECLAIQIQDNNIFREAKKMLTGDILPESGEVRMDGKKVKLIGNMKVAVVQEMAVKTMVFPELDYMENLCISVDRRMPSVWRKNKICFSIRQEYGPILGEEVFHTPIEELSEKQKYQMIYTRILLQKPRVVFCIQPFKGADHSHRMFVWKMLEMLLNHGIAVVILSLNLSDSLALADRLLIIDGSGSVKEVPKKEFATIPIAAPWIHLYKNQ